MIESSYAKLAPGSVLYLWQSSFFILHWSAWSVSLLWSSLCGTTLSILGDPGAVSGGGKKAKRARKKIGRRKVKKESRSPWDSSLNRPVPKYFCAQSQARILNGFGTGRLREESQGLLLSFLTFLRPIFFLARLAFFPPPLTAPGSPRMHFILTNRRAVIASVAMWLWAVLVTSVFPQALRADENETFDKFVISLYPCYPRLCSQSRGKFASAKAYNTFLFIILLGIPLVTILSSYGYVFVVSRNHRRRINAQDSNPAQLSTIKQEFKVTLILAIVVFLCLLSFLPLFILSIISFQFENTNRDNSKCYFIRLRRHKKYAYLVALGLNAICNPLIYGLGNRRLRVAIRKLLKCNNLDEN